MTTPASPTTTEPATPRFAGAIDAETAAWLDPLFQQVSHWAVCAHMKPDADTLGSALALARLLERLGRQVVVVCADSVIERFAFMPGAEKVLVNRLPDAWPASSGLVTLDAAEVGRLGSLAALTEQLQPVVNIDHHISNPRFGSHNWIDVRSAATGEMVYLLYDHFGLPVDDEAAIALYAALITDTGFFRYPATTDRTLEVAAALVRTGVNFPGIVEAIYERHSAASVKLLGLALANLQLAANGRVAWVSVPLEMFAAAAASEDEAEGIVEKLREIAGVEVLYILRESLDGPIRVSLRAKTDVDMNAIARHFGGGGHLKAAGCTIEGSLPDAERQLLAVVLEHLPPAQ